jgi:FMN reductase
MRPLFSYLHAVAVPTAVFAAAEDWGGDGAGRALVERIDRAAGELAQLVTRRPAAAPADPFEHPTPFETLLRGV